MRSLQYTRCSRLLTDQVPELDSVYEDAETPRTGKPGPQQAPSKTSTLAHLSHVSGGLIQTPFGMFFQHSHNHLHCCNQLLLIHYSNLSCPNNNCAAQYAVDGPVIRS